MLRNGSSWFGSYSRGELGGLPQLIILLSLAVVPRKRYAKSRLVYFQTIKLGSNIVWVQKPRLDILTQYGTKLAEPKLDGPDGPDEWDEGERARPDA